MYSYHKVRKGIFEWFKETVIQTREGVCCKCQEELNDDWHIDHIIPMSLGGGFNVDNLQILCGFCNKSKKNRESVDYRQWIEGKESHGRQGIEELLTKYAVHSPNRAGGRKAAEE